MMAQYAPEDFLIQQVSESIERYKENKTDQNRRQLGFDMHVLNLKWHIKEKGAQNLMEDFEWYKRTKDLLKPGKN